jgi:hypothetical protein
MHGEPAGDARHKHENLFQRSAHVVPLAAECNKAPAPPMLWSEAGWKDTVRADPNMLTRIIVCFDGYVGRYMWHCHILEHGDNEMMRPFEIVAEQLVAGGSALCLGSSSTIADPRACAFLY